MEQISLSVEPRDGRGKSVANKMRREGRIPGIVYGLDQGSTPIIVPARELSHLLTRGGNNAIVELKLGAESQLTMTKEVQRDPVRGELLHVDFVRVRADQPVQADVPVHLVGEPAGARDGGVLEHQLSTVAISALPANVPAALEGDVSALGVGDHLTVKDLVVPSGVEVVTDPDEIVALLAAPRLAADLEGTDVEAAQAAAADGAAAPGDSEAAASGGSEGGEE